MADKKHDGTDDDAIGKDPRPDEPGQPASDVPPSDGAEDAAGERAPDADAGQDAPRDETHPLAEPRSDAEGPADDPLGEPRSESSDPAPPRTEAPDAAAPLGSEDPAPRDDPLTSRPATEPEDHHYEAHEDDGGSSFAARALMALVLLIAGAALGIWAAPRLAPQLPSGMAPVAEWLTPGAPADDERMAALSAAIDDVRSQVSGLSDRIGSLSDTVGDGPIDPRISDAVGQLRSQIEQEIAALRDQVAALSEDDLDQRLARLDSTLQGQVAELTDIRDQLTANTDSEATEQAAAQIDVYQSQLEGLRGELGSVSDAVASLRNRIDEVSATADRSIQTAQEQVEQVQAEAQTALSDAAIESDVALIRAAMAAGQSFPDPAARLSEDSNVTLPEGLEAAADSGAPTLLTLQERFPDAAHEAIRAAIAAEGEGGLLARSRAFIEAQVATRSLTPQEGSDADAVLSRVEDHLQSGELAAALSEAEALPEEARAAMQGWLDDAELRQNAEEGLAQLQSNLPATN